MPMSAHFYIRVWGPRARFTAPHTRGEPYSEDVMSPSAGTRLLTTIYAKPEFCWVLEAIHVLRRIQKENIVIKGPKGSSDVTLQTATDLIDVEYVVRARIEINPARTNDRAKYIGEAHRRLSKGERFQPISLGIREYEAFYELMTQDEYEAILPIDDSRPLGPLLYANVPTDRWHLDEYDSVFFEAHLRRGTLDIPEPLHREHVPRIMAHNDRRARGAQEAA